MNNKAKLIMMYISALIIVIESIYFVRKKYKMLTFLSIMILVLIIGSTIYIQIYWSKLSKSSSKFINTIYVIAIVTVIFNFIAIIGTSANFYEFVTNLFKQNQINENEQLTVSEYEENVPKFDILTVGKIKMKFKNILQQEHKEEEEKDMELKDVCLKIILSWNNIETNPQYLLNTKKKIPFRKNIDVLQEFKTLIKNSLDKNTEIVGDVTKLTTLLSNAIKEKTKTDTITQLQFFVMIISIYAASLMISYNKNNQNVTNTLAHYIRNENINIELLEKVSETNKTFETIFQNFLPAITFNDKTEFDTVIKSLDILWLDYSRAMKITVLKLMFQYMLL